MFTFNFKAQRKREREKERESEREREKEELCQKAFLSLNCLSCQFIFIFVSTHLLAQSTGVIHSVIDHPRKKVLNLKGAFQRTFNRPLSRLFLLQVHAKAIVRLIVSLTIACA